MDIGTGRIGEKGGGAPQRAQRRGTLVIQSMFVVNGTGIATLFIWKQVALCRLERF